MMKRARQETIGTNMKGKHKGDRDHEAEAQGIEARGMIGEEGALKETEDTEIREAVWIDVAEILQAESAEYT